MTDPARLAMWSSDHCHYFDVRGTTRAFAVEWDEGGWSTVRVDDTFSQRCTATFDGDDVVTSTGDVSYDAGATWRHDFAMTLRRVAARGGGAG